MPRLSGWFVRAALLWLALGFTIGALLLWNKATPIGPWVWRLLPLHMEALVVGWFLQLVAGISFWILPRWQNQRGDERPEWMAWILINAGILLVALGPWISLAGWLPLAGRTLEVIGAAAYVLHAWPRVKPWMEKA